MTIAKTTAFTEYAGNGATTAFSFPYRFFADADLEVSLISSAGAKTVKTLTTHYTLSNTGTESGGTVTMLAAPATGETLRIQRIVEATQSTDYTANDAFPAETHETALDRLTVIAQDAARDIDRAIKLPPGTDGELTNARYSRVLGFTATGAVDYLPLTPIQTADGEILYASVTAMVASAEASRSEGAAWRAGPFIYTEAASAATDHHLTTAGGVKLYAEALFGRAFHVDQFGAAVSGSAGANTTAIQNAINAASKVKLVEVWFGAGQYLFNNLFLHYHATDNPGFNSAAYEQGRIILKGAGRHTKNNYTNSSVRGTVLKSASSTGTAAIYALNGQMVRFEDMSIVANNTTKIMHIEGCEQNSGMTNVFFKQEGTGAGCWWKDLWNSHFENVFGEGAGKATSTGEGLYIFNEALAAGFISLNTVNVNNFGKSIVLGHQTRTSAARLHSVRGINVQGGDATTGVTIGGGIASSDIDIHCEQNDLGFRVINNPKNLRLKVTSASNTKTGEIGSATSGENYYDGVTINGEFLDTPTGTMVEVFNGANTKNLMFCDTLFAGGAGSVGLVLASGTHTNLRVLDPRWGSSLGTTITNPEGIQELRESKANTFRTGATGGALAAPPHQFISDTTVGAQAVLSVQQADLDQPFVRFKTALTPAANANHINTSALGAYYGRVAVQIDTGAGIVTKWVALYDS